MGGNGIGDEFQQRSNISPTRLAGGRGCTEQWARWPSSGTLLELSYDEQGYVCINKHILFLESGLLWLCILQYHHNHPVFSHFGINKTMALICWDYVWPNLHSFVTNYCRSCTTCSPPSPNVTSLTDYSDNFPFQSILGILSLWTSSNNSRHPLMASLLS